MKHSFPLVCIRGDNNLSFFNYYSHIDKLWLKCFVLTVDNEGGRGILSFVDDVILFYLPP
jgi:hypothetical protein